MRTFPGLVFNRHQAAEFKSQNGNQKPTAQGDDAAHEEMMYIVTHSVHPQPQGGEKEQPGDIQEEYPPNIRLLRLLNLRPRRAARLDANKSIPPNTPVIVVFFSWGFSYGFVSTIGTQLGQQVTPSRGTLFQAFPFFGFHFGPTLVGRIILTRLGFSASFVGGLYIFGSGSLLFWPSGILVSWPLTLVSGFITSFGVGILEATASLFISICGPLEYSEARVNFAQGCEGIGAPISCLLTAKVLLRNAPDVTATIAGQWAYLAIAFFVVLLAIIFYYLPVPEAPAEDLRALARRRPNTNNAKVLGVPVVYVTLVLGVWSIFFDIAGQEAYVGEFPRYLPVVWPSIGTAIWIVSRFGAAGIQFLGVKPRWILLVSVITSIITAVVSMETSGKTSLSFSHLIWFTGAPIYSTAFPISVRGTGAHSKTAACFLAAGLGGGGFAYIVRYAVQLAIGDPASMCVSVGFFSASAIFPVYLNLVPAAKRQVDPIQDEYVH